MSGYKFELENNDEILKINSPKKSLRGPYTVVCKDLIERWAIVTMDWEGNPRLGIRWFWGENGNPISRSFPTWFVIPPSLSKNILSGIPIDHQISGKIDEFLQGKITGIDLKGAQ
ncbi:MAG: hypothetical protein PF638_05240 [Candidatus Delongbacteria bacterium]|jgi:hypothetical protein|nr:hypothetical protein [Candidatus Delongbacteria bacterium]